MYYPNGNNAAVANPAIPLQRQQKNTPLEILLVEDEPSDMVLAEASLNAIDLDCEVRTLQDGHQVLPYLRHEGKYQGERVPDILFLDLTLPTRDGFEVLAEMAAQSGRFDDLPIVILTGDVHSSFLKRTHGLNIVSFMTKPCTAEKIGAVIAGIHWK